MDKNTNSGDGSDKVVGILTFKAPSINDVNTVSCRSPRTWTQLHLSRPAWSEMLWWQQVFVKYLNSKYAQWLTSSVETLPSYLAIYLATGFCYWLLVVAGDANCTGFHHQPTVWHNTEYRFFCDTVRMLMSNYIPWRHTPLQSSSFFSSQLHF